MARTKQKDSQRTREILRKKIFKTIITNNINIVLLNLSSSLKKGGEKQVWLITENFIPPFLHIFRIYHIYCFHPLTLRERISYTCKPKLKLGHYMHTQHVYKIVVILLAHPQSRIILILRSNDSLNFFDVLQLEFGVFQPGIQLLVQFIFYDDTNKEWIRSWIR